MYINTTDVKNDIHLKSIDVFGGTYISNYTPRNITNIEITDEGLKSLMIKYYYFQVPCVP